MTKYIHYKNSIHSGNVLISDKPTEDGWHLYSEVECAQFDEVLASVISYEHKSFQESVIERGAACCITSSLISHLEIENFRTADYRIKIHENGMVLVYSRSVE